MAPAWFVVVFASNSVFKNCNYQVVVNEIKVKGTKWFYKFNLEINSNVCLGTCSSPSWVLVYCEKKRFVLFAFSFFPFSRSFGWALFPLLSFLPFFWLRSCIERSKASTDHCSSPPSLYLKTKMVQIENS